MVSNSDMREETANILSMLDSFALETEEDVAMAIAADFRKRRIEKNLTREMVARQSGVPMGNLSRFEQKGLISLKNLISLAIALGYTSEIKGVFSRQKYSTMEELTEIRRNAGRKTAHQKRKPDEKD